MHLLNLASLAAGHEPDWGSRAGGIALLRASAATV